MAGGDGWRRPRPRPRRPLDDRREPAAVQKNRETVTDRHIVPEGEPPSELMSPAADGGGEGELTGGHSRLPNSQRAAQDFWTASAAPPRVYKAGKAALASCMTAGCPSSTTAVGVLRTPARCLLPQKLLECVWHHSFLFGDTSLRLLAAPICLETGSFAECQDKHALTVTGDRLHSLAGM